MTCQPYYILISIEEENIRLPWNWSYGVLLAIMWVLEIESGSVARIASALNAQPSLQPRNDFFELIDFRVFLHQCPQEY